ncbi:hypothetical protein V1293_003771 [Bradyrhizobium sp. AZCC 1693]
MEPDRSITVTRQNSVGPLVQRRRGHVWSSCCGPHLGSGHVRPHHQTGHMAAIASIKNQFRLLPAGAVHIWVPAFAGTTWDGFSDSTVKQREDASLRSRGTMYPRFASSFALLLNRGRREDRVLAAPAVSRAICANKSAHEHTGQREHSGLPCAMALRFTSCSSRRTAFLPPSPPRSFRFSWT